ncbi:MAG: hypothetical protein QW224_06320 [Desulfurococcaceae archaeon]
MKYHLGSVSKLLTKQGYVICKRSDVKKTHFIKALKYILVHSISRDINAAIKIKLYQSNTSIMHLYMEIGKKVLYEIAHKLKNTRFSIIVSEDCLIRAIYTSSVVKTLRDTISSIEFKGG